MRVEVQEKIPMSQASIAAGHPLTALAAKHILEQGGNAYDAIIAGVFAACISEPVLASLGGGGYLLAQPSQSKTYVYDFFVQTPLKKAKKSDFYPISADFGTTRQTFHIGLGSVATPGLVRGLFKIHRDLATLPMRELVTPAIQYAKEGIRINDFQAYVMDIIRPILQVEKKTQNSFLDENGQLLKQGSLQKNPQLADFLDNLVREGESFFYQGEVAHSVDQICNQNGGLLSIDDFHNYQVIQREPLQIQYKGHDLYTNPTPSCGGILICCALKILEKCKFVLADMPPSEYTLLLCNILQRTNLIRAKNHNIANSQQLLSESHINQHFDNLDTSHLVKRGTTHLSVIDGNRNVASLSLSNGEGCGWYIPNTGIMLNNMLGEEDLNPAGFLQWKENTRMNSMLAPSILKNIDHSIFAIGSGGSNRLRTAILQLVINLVDFKLELQQAVNRPRIHFEENVLHLEGGQTTEMKIELDKLNIHMKTWDSLNLFFGGTHVCGIIDGQFVGAGDPRRGGSAVLLS